MRNFLCNCNFKKYKNQLLQNIVKIMCNNNIKYNQVVNIKILLPLDGGGWFA